MRGGLCGKSSSSVTHSIAEDKSLGSFASIIDESAESLRSDVVWYFSSKSSTAVARRISNVEGMISKRVVSLCLPFLLFFCYIPISLGGGGFRSGRRPCVPVTVRYYFLFSYGIFFSDRDGEHVYL